MANFPHLDVRGTYNVTEYYNPLARTLGRVSQVLLGFYVDLQPSSKYPGPPSTILYYTILYRTNSYYTILQSTPNRTTFPQEATRFLEPCAGPRGVGREVGHQLPPSFAEPWEDPKIDPR